MHINSDGINQSVEIIVKSFMRFEKLQRLVTSVHASYPGLTIRIADDSPGSAIRDATLDRLERERGCHVTRLPFDVGVSAGRNLLLDQVATDYFVLCDDDFVFNKYSSLESLQSVLQADPSCVVAGGTDLIDGVHANYFHGHFETAGKRITRYVYGHSAPAVRVGGVRCVPCRFTPNFFMGSKRLFDRHRIRWKSELKIREHSWFFMSMPAELNIYSVPGVFVDHFPGASVSAPEYEGHRRDPAKLAALEDDTGHTLETAYMYQGGWRYYAERIRLILDGRGYRRSETAAARGGNAT